MKKFVFLPDIHYGFERKNRKKIPIHDPAALRAVGHFLDVFRPDVLIWGGDTLDCSAISHHVKGNARAVEGMRLVDDTAELGLYIQSFRDLSGATEEVYFVGNHEDWLEDLADEYPALEGILDLNRLLPLPGVQIIPQGGSFSLGKLHFIHGDQIRSGQHIAANVVTTYGRNVRLGHFHQYQAFTRVSPLDQQDVHTAIVVPGLCKRDPGYGKGAPNRHCQGFLWGYVQPNGNFTDYVSIISKGRFIALDKEFGG